MRLFLAVLFQVSVCHASPAEMSVGWGHGIEFTRPDNPFKMNLRFRMQNLVSWTGETATSAPVISPQVRRVRLRVTGQLLSPELLYTLQFSFSRQDMDWDNSAFPNVLRDASILWKAAPWAHFVFGLAKLPGNRQRVVSSGEMQMIDRSSVNRVFTLDRDFGAQAHFFAEPFSLKLAISSGEGRGTVNSDTGLSYTARAEALPLGEFKKSGEYFEGDLEREPRPKLALGLGVLHNDRAKRTGGQLGQTLSSARSFQTTFADSVFKWRGFSFYAEYMRRDCPNPVVSAVDRLFVTTGEGLLLQSGAFFSETWEAVGRVSWILPGAAVQTLTPRQTQATLGLNKYFSGHRVKIQGDLSWTQEETVGASTFAYWGGRFQVELGI